MGLSFSAAGRTDDVQLHSDRQQKPNPPLQTLYEGLCCQQAKCGILQPAVQKQA